MGMRENVDASDGHAFLGYGPGLWLVPEPALRSYLTAVGNLGPAMMSREDLFSAPDPTTKLLTVRPDGVGVLAIRGMIRRYATPINSALAEVLGGTTLDWIGAALDGAIASDKVKCVLLDVDSPGGEANGIAEMAGRIEAASKVKPMGAYVGGLGTSAAYWLAAATGRITAAPSAFLGSIGTVRVIEDDSALMEKMGIKTHVFVSSQSPRKWPDPNTLGGKMQIQEYVDAQSDIFLADIAKCRHTTPLRAMEDFGQGDMVIASEALKVGMIDQVGTLASAIAELKRSGTGAGAGVTRASVPKFVGKLVRR